MSSVRTLSERLGVSDPHRAERDWRLYAQDMMQFAQRISAYSKGMDRDDFIADTRTYDAVLRNIELIGEAAGHIPDHIRAEHSDIEWRQIIGARNRLAHAYLGIDDDVVWDIVTIGVPKVLHKLQNLLDSTLP